MLLLFQEWYLITKLPYYLRKEDLKLRKTVEIPNCDTNCGNSISSSISSSKTSSFSSSISTSFSSTISNSISNIISSSISSSFSSSPPLTKLLCQGVVFRNILSANNLQRLHKDMLSIHVLSFSFFCLFVRPSACLTVFLFFMLLLFQEWYLTTKLPYYLWKGDLKLRKTVEIPNCNTNCGNSISSSISSRISSSISSTICFASAQRTEDCEAGFGRKKTWSKSVDIWEMEFDDLWIFYLQDLKGGTLILWIFYLPTTKFSNILCASQLL